MISGGGITKTIPVSQAVGASLYNITFAVECDVVTAEDMSFYLTVEDLDTGSNPQTANGTIAKGSGPREGFEVSVDEYSVPPSQGLLITCTFMDGIFFDEIHYADWIVSGIKYPTEDNPCDVIGTRPANPDFSYTSHTIYDNMTDTRYTANTDRVLDDRSYIYEIRIPAAQMDPNNGHIDVQVNFRM